MRKLFLGICVALGLVSAGAAQAGYFNPKSFTLDNGMQVVVIEDHRAPVVSHMVWFKAGAADEPAGSSGIAHFFEHLVFKGTDKRKVGEFSDIIARNGGQDNAFTSQDYTGYFQNISADKLELVMQLFADQMANLRLTETDIETERDVVLEERRSRIDNDPGSKLAEEMNAALYRAHPYGTPLIGWEHEIRTLGLDDALAWKEKYYAPNNSILIVGGDVTAEKVRALAEKYYGTIPRGPKLKAERQIEPPHRAPRRVAYRDPQVRQESFQRFYMAPSRSHGASEHALPLSVLSEILSGGADSRFYKHMVIDRKIASAAGGYYSSISRDWSSFAIYAVPSPDSDVGEVEAEMDRLIADLKEKGVSREEVARAISRITANAIYARDSMFTAPRIFGRALTSGMSVADVENWPEDIARVTVEEVNAAARHVFDLKRSVTGLLLKEESGQ